jgi:hypothetical protein
MRVLPCKKWSVQALEGATLAEVLVSAMVVSITAVSLYGSFFSGYALTRLSRDDIRATQIMLEKIEAVRLADWNALSNCPIHFRDTLENTGVGTVFTGVISTKPVPGLPNSAAYKNDICLLSVKVFWTNQAQRLPLIRQREMETAIARHGLAYHAPAQSP